MPIRLDFDPAIFKWQAKHGVKLTYAELAKRAGISEPTIYRLTSAQPTKLDLQKLNSICKVLECNPGDLLARVDTGAADSLEAVEQNLQDRADNMKIIRAHMDVHKQGSEEQ
jgi:putative transcriptional regulator